MNKFTKNILIQALNNMPAPTVIVDAQKDGMPVVLANCAAQILTGREDIELIGTSFADMLVQGNLPGRETEHQADRQQWQTSEGASVPLDVRLSPLLDHAGRLSFWMLSVVGDATVAGDLQSSDRKVLRNALFDARRQIKSLKRTDTVTGLANRSAFCEVLERDWSVARREQRRITVIAFSVDCLAEYRAIYGRHATDSLLQKVGHAIGGTLRRSGDFCARIANDRFAVLIGNQEEEQAMECANRITAKVSDLAIHHPRSTVARFVTVSFGASSEVPAWTKKSGTLLDEAERQLEPGGQAQKTGVQKNQSDERFATGVVD